MSTFKLTLAYDGTDFVGWQRQADGVSIQGLVEEALALLDARPVAVTGAGRTDAGVHALGQVASFTLSRDDIDAATVVNALNARLPPTVRALEACAAPPRFHARYAAKSKTYRYRIWNGTVMNPFERRYAWHVTSALDPDAMAAAAATLEGTHDFAVFQSGGGDVPSTVRTVTSSRIYSTTKAAKDTKALIEYEISGDGFLRHMVRAIVGTLVDIGRGRWPPDAIVGMLASGDRGAAGRTAPPEGLFLVRVEYGDYNV